MMTSSNGSKHTHSEVWDETTNLFLNFNGCVYHKSIESFDIDSGQTVMFILFIYIYIYIYVYVYVYVYIQMQWPLNRHTVYSIKYEHGLMCPVVLLLYHQLIVVIMIVSQTVIIFHTVGINHIYWPKIASLEGWWIFVLRKHIYPRFGKWRKWFQSHHFLAFYIFIKYLTNYLRSYKINILLGNNRTYFNVVFCGRGFIVVVGKDICCTVIWN